MIEPWVALAATLYVLVAIVAVVPVQCLMQRKMKNWLRFLVGVGTLLFWPVLAAVGFAAWLCEES